MREIGLLIIAILSFTISRAQYTVISDDSTYIPTSTNALLEVHSNNGNKGVLVPRLTTAQRTALVTVAPADNSLLVYDSDTKTYWYWDGTSWVEIVPGGTDDQLLTLSNDTLYIENGNWIYLGNFNDWKLIGNAAASANFIGTTNAIDFRMYTNNTERMTIESNGNVGIGTTTPGYPLTVVSATNPATGVFFNTQPSVNNDAVYGECSTSDGFGIGGHFIGGYIGSYNNVSPTGSASYLGVYGNVDGGSGTNFGIRGYATGIGDDYGVYGSVNGATDLGIEAFNEHSSGTGLLAIGNNAIGSYLTTGTGIAGTGNDGIYGMGKSVSDGTGVIGVGNNNSSIYTLTGGSGGAFTGTDIGVAGWGTNSDGSGGYFSNGSGSYAYVGLTFGGTNYKINGNGSVSTIVKNVDNKDVNMFCPEAPEITFQDYGIGQLIDGNTHITIDPTLAKNIHIDDNHPLKVFIQLEGNCNGVYVTNKSANGFDVVELNNGSSNVSFSWMLIANRADEIRTDINGNQRISRNADVRFPPAPKYLNVKTNTSKTVKKADIPIIKDKIKNK